MIRAALLLMGLVSAAVAADTAPVIINEPVTITVAAGQALSHTVLATVASGSTVTATITDAPGGLAKPAWISAGTAVMNGTQASIPLVGNARGFGVVRFRLVLTTAELNTNRDFTLIVVPTSG